MTEPARSPVAERHDALLLERAERERAMLEAHRHTLAEAARYVAAMATVSGNLNRSVIADMTLQIQGSMEAAKKVTQQLTLTLATIHAQAAQVVAATETSTASTAPEEYRSSSSTTTNSSTVTWTVSWSRPWEPRRLPRRLTRYRVPRSSYCHRPRRRRLAAVRTVAGSDDPADTPGTVDPLEGSTRPPDSPEVIRTKS